MLKIPYCPQLISTKSVTQFRDITQRLTAKTSDFLKQVSPDFGLSADIPYSEADVFVNDSLDNKV